MKNWNVILGVDVSKLTLDICCAERNLYLKTDNGAKGFAEFEKWCKINEIKLNDTLVVLEHTGGYEYRFLHFCQLRSIAYCRVPGLEIKQSLGMVRGKSDHADASRISRYGEEKIKKLKPDTMLDEKILLIRQLLSFRKRVVRENAGLKSTVKERKHMYAAKQTDTIIQIAEAKIMENKRHIRQIEEAITATIRNNEAMLQTYRIITSIRGIGDVNAWMTIAYTENFTCFTDARKYAAYVGVVPYEHTSGTSIRGRKRVSHLAHKEIKQELNQAAKTAIRHDPELRAYAERKLKNKAYPLVLNNVKFKLILRMFSLIKRGESFVDNYRNVA